MNELRKDMLPTIKVYIKCITIIFVLVHFGMFLVITHSVPLELKDEVPNIVVCLYQLFTSILYGIMALSLFLHKNISQKGLARYILITIIEVSIESLLCIQAFGIYCSFQNYIFIVISFVVLERYVSQGKRPVILYVLLAIIYSAILLITYNTGTADILNNKAKTFFTIANTIGTIGILLFFSIFIVDMIIKVEGKLTYMATRDKLTGLPNRQVLHNDLTASKTAVAMIDIDSFKKINDTYGHDVGDLVLIDLAKRMERLTVEGYCSAIRWGGEEFLIIFNTTLASEDIIRSKIYELLLSVRHSNNTFAGIRIPYTITVGVAKSDMGYNVEDIIKKADDRLYIGKNSGKDRIIFYTDEVIK